VNLLFSKKKQVGQQHLLTSVFDFADKLPLLPRVVKLNYIFFKNKITTPLESKDRLQARVC
jgi:hypothetical protein